MVKYRSMFLKNLSLILLLLSHLSLSAQYVGTELIDEKQVYKWIPKLEIEYYGEYHFGESEAESTLIFTGSSAQIKSGEFKYLDDKWQWVWHFKSLHNVKIEKGGIFYSDEYKGEFVYYTEGGKRQKYLKIYDSWSGLTDKGQYELGVKIDAELSTTLPGNYAEASVFELELKMLQKLSSKELKIMRNEIFARYGYKFIKGGEMDLYFKRQSWYIPQHSNVKQFLTDIEKQNIELILLEEAQRNKDK